MSDGVRMGCVEICELQRMYLRWHLLKGDDRPSSEKLSTVSHAHSNDDVSVDLPCRITFGAAVGSPRSFAALSIRTSEVTMRPRSNARCLAVVRKNLGSRERAGRHRPATARVPARRGRLRLLDGELHQSPEDEARSTI